MLTFSNGKTFKKHAFCIRQKGTIHPDDYPENLFEEICLELNKQQHPKKSGQGRPVTPSTAAQPKQPAKQVGQGSSRTPTTSAQTKTSNKPPAAPAANLPPVKSKNNPGKSETCGRREKKDDSSKKQDAKIRSSSAKHICRSFHVRKFQQRVQHPTTSNVDYFEKHFVDA